MEKLNTMILTGTYTHTINRLTNNTKQNHNLPWIRKWPWLVWGCLLHRIKYSCFVNIYPASDNSSSIITDATRIESERLMKLYGNDILRFAYSYLHNISDAEDILQDTLIQFLKTSPVLKNEAHEKKWLFCVAANLSKNRIRYNKLRETDELEDDLHMEGREDLTFVWEAMKKLPDIYREVIHLYYYEGYSTAQIGKILERKESTIRSNLKRGREKLKIILKEEYDFEEI